MKNIYAITTAALTSTDENDVYAGGHHIAEHILERGRKYPDAKEDAYYFLKAHKEITGDTCTLERQVQLTNIIASIINEA